MLQSYDNIPPPVKRQKYRDEGLIEHGVIGDAEMDMSNSSRQEKKISAVVRF